MFDIIELLKFDFFRNAVFAAIMASISCGILGTYIVSRRIVFISGGITHASFGGIGIGYYLGVNPILGASVFSIFVAWAIEWLTYKGKIRNDSVIAMLWSFGMALGVIFIYLTPGYAPNLMGYLFGSILTVSSTEILIMLVITLLLVAIFILFYPLIFYVTFDNEFAKSRKAPVYLINVTLITLVAVVVVLNIKVVGLILILSLIAVPPNAANLLTKNFKGIIFISIVYSLIGVLLGLFMSYYFEIPSGATIIFVLILMFFVTKILSFFGLGMNKLR